MVDNPLETKDYTITVDFKKGSQRVIQGTYDKKALPECWGDFADSVWQFMRFYGMGEILDPAVYEKVKRRRTDYIYCSVEFEESYKSYGNATETVINGKTIKVLPLAHPRQIGALGAHSERWHLAHKEWEGSLSINK